MSENDYTLKIEEFKEAQEEYRYRDRMMVQEFGLAMVAISVLVNRLWTEAVTLGYLVALMIGGLFIAILTLHLHHINQDRRAALDRKEVLRKELGFTEIHLGTGGRRLSAPRTMVWFTATLIPVWAVWMIVALIGFFLNPRLERTGGETPRHGPVPEPAGCTARR